MNEIARNPGLVDPGDQKFQRSEKVFDIFQQLIEDEVAKGTIKPIDPKMLWMNLVSLVMMPFVAKSWISHLFRLDDPGYLDLMKQRQGHVADFLIENIRKS